MLQKLLSLPGYHTSVPTHHGVIDSLLWFTEVVQFMLAWLSCQASFPLFKYL